MSTPNSASATTKKTKNNNPLSMVTKPIKWVRMLSTQLNPTFTLSVFLVYGLGQGFFKVVSDYYWKDMQKLQPSTVQLYVGVHFIPWVLKPLWGILIDVFLVFGYRRRPYFAIPGAVGTVSTALIALPRNLAS